MSSNRGVFAASFAGAAAGAALSQPGGARRVLGVVGLIATIIVTIAVLTIFNQPNLPSFTLGTVNFVVLGAIWLPWPAAKTAFPWMKLRWHWSITAEIFRARHTTGLVILGVMGLSAVVAIITTAAGAYGGFAIALVAYVIAGLAWGFLTAGIARRTADATTA